jgi:hypothetical protein
MMEPCRILVAIREDLARLRGTGAALDDAAIAELYGLLTTARDALGELPEAWSVGHPRAPTQLARTV